MVLSKALPACRESRRVCWQTTGTSDSITLENSVARGIYSGSFRLLKRTCLVRSAGTVSRYITGDRSE